MSKQLERMKTIMGLNESKSLKNKELLEVKKAKNNKYYGIVKENGNFFLKMTQITEKNKNIQDLTEDDFVYVGGVQNKLNERYSSYSMASKQLNMKIKSINEAYDNVYEADEEEVEEPVDTTAQDDSMGMDKEDSGIDSDLSKDPDLGDEKDAVEEPVDVESKEEKVEDEPLEEPESDLVDVGSEESEDDENEPTKSDSDIDVSVVQGHISQKMSELMSSKVEIDSQEVQTLLNSVINPLKEKGLLDLLDEKQKQEYKLMFLPSDEKNEAKIYNKEKMIKEGIEKLMKLKPTFKNRITRLQDKKKKLQESKSFSKKESLNEEKLRKMVRELAKKEILKRK